MTPEQAAAKIVETLFPTPSVRVFVPGRGVVSGYVVEPAANTMQTITLDAYQRMGLREYIVGVINQIETA